MSNTRHTRSRYLLLSDGLYQDGAGRVARLVYSARRATLFAVDARTGQALEQGDLDSIEAQQLARLAALEAVVPVEEDELSQVLARMRTASDDPSRRSFTIMPTSYCNMACSYCGQEHFKSSARMQRLAHRVEAVIADPVTEQVHVSWFGGEPMLALGVIRELSKRFIAAANANGTGYSASMPTNGSLLTERTLRVLREDCALDDLEVTIDGPPEVHDRRRLKRNGSGSFHQIVTVLRDSLPPGINLTIRVNIDSDNEDSVADLLHELARVPLKPSSLALMPVHSWGNDVSDVELGVKRFAEREAEWLRLAASLGFGVGAIPNALKRTTCAATTRYAEIVDPAERVYSCSEHPLVPGVRDSGVIATAADLMASTGKRPAGIFDDWYDSVEAHDVQCGGCPILPVCGGSCPKLWREGHIPCPSIKFNFQDRLELAASRLGFYKVNR